MGMDVREKRGKDYCGLGFIFGSVGGSNKYLRREVENGMKELGGEDGKMEVIDM